MAQTDEAHSLLVLRPSADDFESADGRFPDEGRFLGRRFVAGLLTMVALGGVGVLATRQSSLRPTAPARFSRKGVQGKDDLDSLAADLGELGLGDDSDDPGADDALELQGEREKRRARCEKARRLSTAAACRNPSPGDECHDMVRFLKTRGLAIQPDAYPAITMDSSFEEIQAEVHAVMPKVCAPPCIKGFSGKSTSGDGLDDALQALGLDGCDDDDDDDEEGTGHCHTALPKEACYDAVLYVATDGVITRPMVFHGLNIGSSLHDIQAFLHENPDAKPGADCSKPCEDSCHDAIEGEPCYTNIMWAMSDGINSKNASVWFPGLNNKSSFAEFQSSISNDWDATVHCPTPCTKFCRTASPGEKCFEAVDWVMKIGLRKRPDSYAGLSVYSSFEEVQKHLYKNKSEAAALCPEPCAPAIKPR
jgi:hypothetical protein